METIGRYNVICELGRGATGIVFKALDSHLSRLVAIKLHSTSGSQDEGKRRMAEMFSREARTVARLAHPGIVQIYDVFEDPNSLDACMVMEFVAGGTLASSLSSGQPLPLDRALDLIRQVAEALDYAHSQHFLHLDLKPANILLTEAVQCKVADFGLAKFSGRVGGIHTESINGTPAFIAPERILGKNSDERSDVFSLGVIFYQLLTGHVPFNGDVESILYKIMNDQPELPSRLNPTLPPAYDQLIMRCLAKDAAQRLSSAREFLEEIALLPRSAKAETVAGISPATSADIRDSSISTAEDVAQVSPVKPAGPRRASSPRRRRRARPRRQKWSVKKIFSPQSPLTQYAGLVLLSLALLGKVWPNILEESRRTTPSLQALTKLTAPTINHSSILGGSDPFGVSARGAMSSRRALESLDLADAAFRHVAASLISTLDTTRMSAASVWANTPTLAPRRSVEHRTLHSTSRKSVARFQPASARHLRFVCEHDLREGTLSVSLDGTEAFRETFMGKKRSFFSLEHTYQGEVSWALTIPANTSRVSVHVSNADKSLDLDGAISSNVFGNGQGTLLATVKSGALHLKWAPAQAH